MSLRLSQLQNLRLEQQWSLRRASSGKQTKYRLSFWQQTSNWVKCIQTALEDEKVDSYETRAENINYCFITQHHRHHQRGRERPSSLLPGQSDRGGDYSTFALRWWLLAPNLTVSFVLPEKDHRLQVTMRYVILNYNPAAVRRVRSQVSFWSRFGDRKVKELKLGWAWLIV